MMLMSSTTPAAERARLRDRLRVLDEERGHIEYALTILDRLAVAGEPVAQPERERSVPVRASGNGRSMVDIVMSVINSDMRVWTLSEIVQAIRDGELVEDLDSKMNNVHTSLSRAVSRNRIKRVGHRAYAPLLYDAPDDEGTEPPRSSAVDRIYPIAETP